MAMPGAKGEAETAAPVATPWASGGADPLQEALGHPGHLARAVVEEDDAGLAPGHFPAAFLVAHAPQQVAAVLVEIRRRHFHHHGLAVEGFGLVLQGRVHHHDAHAFHVQLGVAEGLEEAHPGFRHQGQQQGVVQVAAVIDVADVEGNLGGKGKAFGQFDLDAGHGRGRDQTAQALPCLLHPGRPRHVGARRLPARLGLLQRTPPGRPGCAQCLRRAGGPSRGHPAPHRVQPGGTGGRPAAPGPASQGLFPLRRSHAAAVGHAGQPFSGDRRPAHHRCGRQCALCLGCHPAPGECGGPQLLPGPAPGAPDPPVFLRSGGGAHFRPYPAGGRHAHPPGRRQLRRGGDGAPGNALFPAAFRRHRPGAPGGHHLPPLRRRPPGAAPARAAGHGEPDPEQQSHAPAGGGRRAGGRHQLPGGPRPDGTGIRLQAHRRLSLLRGGGHRRQGFPGALVPDPGHYQWRRADFPRRPGAAAVAPGPGGAAPGRGQPGPGQQRAAFPATARFRRRGHLRPGPARPADLRQPGSPAPAGLRGGTAPGRFPAAGVRRRCGCRPAHLPGGGPLGAQRRRAVRPGRRQPFPGAVRPLSPGPGGGRGPGRGAALCRHRRAQAPRRSDRIPGPPRRPHRSAQPAPGRGPLQPGPRRRQPPRRTGGPALPRPGRLQDHQRLPRPRGGGQGAAGRGRPPAQPPAGERHGEPLRRRRVPGDHARAAAGGSDLPGDRQAAGLSGTTPGPGALPAVHFRFHRRRRLPPRRTGLHHPDAEGRHGHVPRQGRGPEHLPPLRRGHEPACPGDPAPAQQLPARPGRRRIRAAPATPGGPGQRPGGGSRGPGALAGRQPADCPGPFHPGGREQRLHRAPGPVGAAGILSPGGPLAAGAGTGGDHRREHFRHPVQARRPGAHRGRGPGRERPAAASAGAGADREHPAQPDRIRAVHPAHPAGPGGAPVHRRLRHRLFQPGLPEAPGGEQAEDRPVLRAQPGRRCGGCGHRSRHHRNGPPPQPAHRGRRGGNGGGAAEPPPLRLRRGPGLLLRPAPAGG
ncbi:hypothetical protein Lal_00039377 [Lupinus albus]|nr:hypothetical protein Lal_00039377 [Lupinus albus]